MEVEINPNNLINIAIKTLPILIVPDDGLFCHEVFIDNGSLKINPIPSVRYTIITLLGLSNANQHGYKVNIDITEVYNRVNIFQNSLTIGDYGLLLWLDQRFDGKNTKKIVDHINSFLNKIDWHEINNMELSWLIVGLTQYNAQRKKKAKEISDRLFQYFLDNRIAPSGLFYNLGKGARRNYPNFASQIYGIHALSIHARLASNKIAGDLAIQAAQCLSRLQGQKGEWPWIYNARCGLVVEPFEIYGVHQDAMAPMAFHELNAATGYDSNRLISKGLKWLYKENELGINMIDNDKGIIYRSIRRKKPYDKLSLYSRTLASKFNIHLNRKINPSALEVNFTCRPYHLGWILEAWCGKEKFLNRYTII